MAQRERRTKEAAGSKDPAALSGASAGDGQAGTSTEQRSSLRTSTRAHEQCSPRLRQSDAFSSSKKKKKKNQSSRRPLLVAAVKGGQKPQPPPIRGPKFHPVPAPPANMLKLSSNERALKRGVSYKA